MNARSVARIITAQAASDGAGVRLHRSLGTPALSMLDPFLMLDEFRSDDPNDYIAGFPDHPHRGFETVTYLLAGALEHKDSLGNTGRLVTGGAQWMTAGRGVIHSEMPKQENGLLWGFQLWVNLPSRLKMTAPRYQDIEPTRIPEVTLEGGASARVIAGEAGGARGPVEGAAVDPMMLDVRVESGRSASIAIPRGHNAFVYVYDGALTIEGRVVRGRELAALGAGDGVVLHAAGAGEGGAKGGRALVVAGRPIGEQVARYGPFVMNTRSEIERAIGDYQAGTLAV